MPENKMFKILSIDGGGIKGLYSAKILQHFEEKFNCHISDYFDMICGTSTGGLIALALSLKIPAVDIVKFYTEKGPIIFPKRNKLFAIWRQVAWKGKFSDEPLKNALIDIFGEKLIGESNNLLCIPSYTITEARPWIFKFDYGSLKRDNRTKYVDVALATSAAPTYFPMAEIENYNKKQFVDGGIWANNPTIVGYIEALTNFIGPEKDFDTLSILSLSSLSVTGGKPVGIPRKRAFINWRDELFEASMTGQSKFCDYFMENVQHLTTTKVHYTRIPSAEISSTQESLIQLDIATPNALNLIMGKGDDQGLLFSKKPEIELFFKTPKLYNTKKNGKL